jgi:hypothetical protein
MLSRPFLSVQLPKYDINVYWALWLDDEDAFCPGAYHQAV